MATKNTPTTRPESAALEFSEQQRNTLMAAIAKSPAGRPPTEDEWNLLVFQSQSLGLNPFKGEIGMAKWSNDRDAPLVPYITWLGQVRLADAAHKLIGIERYWCGPDGEWKEVWLSDAPPAAAKVVIWLEGLSRPVVGVAPWKSWAKMGFADKLDANGKPIWKEYNGKKYKEKDKTKLAPIGNWATMPDHMLSIAAVRLAAKVARMITGNEDGDTVDAMAETMLFRDRQKRAFALARELGLDDGARHELSGGESWSTIDYELMCEIVAQLEMMQREQDVVPVEAETVVSPEEAAAEFDATIEPDPAPEPNANGPASPEQMARLAELGEELEWQEKVAELQGATSYEEAADLIRQWEGFAAAMAAARANQPPPPPRPKKQEQSTPVEKPADTPAEKPKADVAGHPPALPDWAMFASENNTTVTALKKLLATEYIVGSMNNVPMSSEAGQRLVELVGNEGRLPT